MIKADVYQVYKFHFLLFAFFVLPLKGYSDACKDPAQQLIHIPDRAHEKGKLSDSGYLDTITPIQKSDKRLSLVLGASGVLSLAGIGLTLYLRSRQKARFLEFKLNMARNIHDETSPALLYAKTLAKSTRVENEKGELEVHIEHTMSIIRSLAHDLKSDRQYTLSDLQNTIDDSLQKLSSAGDFRYTIRFEANKKHFISHYQFSQIRAILNECITNTIKHAEFNTIDLTFAQARKKLTITYSDNGKGWGTISDPGIGIKNMEERGKMLNGELKIFNRFPEGYAIQLTVLLR